VDKPAHRIFVQNKTSFVRWEPAVEVEV